MSVTLNLRLVFFAVWSIGEAKSTLEHRSALHLFRLGEAMLRIVRNRNRPLLHKMRAWSVVAPHLVEVWNCRQLQ